MCAYGECCLCCCFLFVCEVRVACARACAVLWWMCLSTTPFACACVFRIPLQTSSLLRYCYCYCCYCLSWRSELSCSVPLSALVVLFRKFAVASQSKPLQAGYVNVMSCGIRSESTVHRSFKSKKQTYH